MLQPICILFLIFFSSLKPAFGQVVINEFSSNSDTEWVEIYNTSDQQINLSDWKIIDGNSNENDDLILNNCIISHGFRKFDHSKGWLNDSGSETITLKNSNNEQIDSIVYGTNGIINTPPAAKSASRNPDGGLSWIILDNPTPQNNDCSIPTLTSTPMPTFNPTNTSIPTSTPIPTNTPTPINTLIPTITKNPTSTPTPKITPIPTSTSIPPTPTFKPTNTPVPNISPILTPTKNLSPTPTAELLITTEPTEEILGVTDIPTTEPTETDKKDEKEKNNSLVNFIPTILIILGSLLLFTPLILSKINHCPKKILRK